MVDVVAGIEGRDADSVVRDVSERIKSVGLPLEYHVEVLGQHTDPMANPLRSWGIWLAAVLGVLLLLQVAIGSWRLAGLVMVTLPLALVGGAVAGLVTGGLGTLAALTGFLAVLTITVRNSIVLIKHLRRIEEESDESVRELVLRGARERFLPMLTTTLVVAAAVLPLVIMGGLPGQEVAGPIAVIILGGLVTSALVNLFVLPSLYLRFAAGQQPDPDLATESPESPVSPTPSAPLAKETTHA